MSSECPYCGEEAVDARGEIAHMEAKHPDVIARRLAEAGLRPPPPGDRLRKLAQDLDYYETIPHPPLRAEMQRAVVIELRVEVERLWRFADGHPHQTGARGLPLIESS